jgi:hypothetical protein
MNKDAERFRNFAEGPLTQYSHRSSQSGVVLTCWPSHLNLCVLDSGLFATQRSYVFSGVGFLKCFALEDAELPR